MTFDRHRFDRLAVLIAMGLGLGVGMVACGGADGTGPTPTTVAISVTPASLSLTVGETATITATVSGGTGTVGFTSSTPAVATVSSSGLVIAVAAGTATITASVTGQTGVQATTQVTVTDPPAAEFAIAFGDITQDGQLVDLSNVSGTIDMEVDITAPAGFEGIVRVLIDGLVAGSVDIPTGGGGEAIADRDSSQAPMRAAANEGRLNENVAVRTYTQSVDAGFVPLFEDGERSIEAVLSGRPTGLQLARAQLAENPAFNNQIRFFHTVTAERRYEDVEVGSFHNAGPVQSFGRWTNYVFSDPPLAGDATAVWEILEGPGGPITLDANVVDGAGTFVLDPVLFPIEGPVQLSQITLRVPGGTPIVVPIGNHEVDDANDGDLDGFFDFASKEITLDNLAPTFAVAWATPEPGKKWVNRFFDPFAFASDLGIDWTGLTQPQTVTDGGSGANGGIDCRFFLFKDPFAVLPFTTPADFDEGPEDWTFEIGCFDPTANEVRARLTDGLGVLRPLSFDFTDPLTTRASGPGLYDDREVTLDLTGGFGWDATDGLSGIKLDGWKVALEVDRPDLTPNERCVVGTLDEATGECTPSESDPSQFVIASSLEIIRGTFVTDGLLDVGYNRATVVGRDDAGNESAPSTTTILHQPSSPIVTQPPTHGGSLPGGESATVESAARDFVDIVRARHDWRYFGEEAYTHTPGFEGNQPFFGGWSPGWTNEVTLVEELEVVITSIEEVLNFSNPKPDGIPNVLKELELVATNVGGNVTRSAVNVQNDWTGQVSTFLNDGVTYFQIEDINNGVNGACNAPDGAGCTNPTELIITTELRTEDPFDESSFTNLLWPYVTSRSANPPGSVPNDAWFSLRERVTDATLTSVDRGTYTEHTYVVTVPAFGLPTDNYKLIMLGVNQDGNALRTVDNFFQVVGF